jgi:transcriptional regulator with XRE-family HTH domain
MGSAKGSRVLPPDSVLARRTPVARALTLGRIDAGMGQQALATRLHVSQTVVSEWERGAQPIPPARLPAIEKVLGISLREVPA